MAGGREREKGPIGNPVGTPLSKNLSGWVTSLAVAVGLASWYLTH